MVPHLRRSTGCLFQPSPSGLGSRLADGPLGLDCKHRFPMFIGFMTSPQARSSAPTARRTARRGGAGQAG